jgi:hypothetical protein
MGEAQTSSTGQTQGNSGGIVNRVKESATAQLTNQKDRGTDALGRVAEAVRSSTQKLRDDQHDTIAGYVDKAADQIEQWSQNLKNKDINELVTDMQRFARRQPALFIGSAFALGVLSARFLKSSRQRSSTDYRSDSSRLQYGGNMAQSTVHDYSGRDIDDTPVVASEAAIPDEFDPVTPASGISSEGVSRTSRGRRSTPRTGQS